MSRTPASRFLTSLGWFAILASFLGALGGVVQIFGYLALQSEDPIIREAVLESVRLQAGPSLSADEVESFLFQHGAFAVVGAFPSVAAGIGLIRRKSWSRKFSIALIVVITLAFLLSIGQMAVAAGWSVRGAAYLGFGALLAAIHLKIVVRLRTAEVLAEFR